MMSNLKTADASKITLLLASLFVLTTQTTLKVQNMAGVLHISIDLARFLLAAAGWVISWFFPWAAPFVALGVQYGPAW
jgi:hypothetical protein